VTAPVCRPLPRLSGAGTGARVTGAREANAIIAYRSTPEDIMTAIPWNAVAAPAAVVVLLLALLLTVPRAIRSARDALRRAEPSVSDWTRPQQWLAAGLAVLGLGITVVAFVVLYQTVTDLLEPYMHASAWTVPVCGEIAFAFLFGNGILLSARRAPGGALRGLLMGALMAGSVLLNVYAARHSVPSAAGHLVVVVAFFGVMLAGKATIMTLRGGKVRADRITGSAWIAHPVHSARLWRWMATWGEPSRAVANERYMRLLFAFTVAKADERVGGQMGWRRNLPDILRYELATGRLPDTGTLEALAEHVRERLSHLPATASGGATDAPEDTPAGAPESRQPPRQAKRQSSASDRAKANAKAQRLMLANPAMPLAEVAAKSGISERTASRIKSNMGRPSLSAVN